MALKKYCKYLAKQCKYLVFIRFRPKHLYSEDDIKLWNRKTTFNHVKFMCVFEVVEKPKVLPLHFIIGLLKIVS